MPNIRSQVATPTTLTIVASDGRTCTITRDEVIAYYGTLSGSVASRRTATIAEFKARIVTALGPEQITATQITLDVDWAGANTQILCELA